LIRTLTLPRAAVPQIIHEIVSLKKDCSSELIRFIGDSLAEIESTIPSNGASKMPSELKRYRIRSNTFGSTQWVDGEMTVSVL
jgi:hypothetical protein